MKSCQQHACPDTPPNKFPENSQVTEALKQKLAPDPVHTSCQQVHSFDILTVLLNHSLPFKISLVMFTEAASMSALRTS